MNPLWPTAEPDVATAVAGFAFLDGADLLLILLVVLILFGIKKLPGLRSGLGSGLEEFLRSSREVQRNLDRMIHEELKRASEEMDTQEQHPTAQGLAARLVVWLAQGFGIGRIPWAPGTFGSVLGLGWFALLLWIAHWNLLVAVAIFLASVIGSVWTCEAAEILMGQKDPGSVVLDEIVALPTCFLGWVFYLWLELGEMPPLELFFGPTTWFLAAGVFLAFRFFDIVKPWPVRQSQDLPHGWGVMVDDQLAAVYVNLTVLAIHVALQISGAGP